MTSDQFYQEIYIYTAYGSSTHTATYLYHPIKLITKLKNEIAFICYVSADA